MLILISAIVFVSEHEVVSYDTINMLRNGPGKSSKSSEFDHRMCLNPVYGTNLV